ncbi:MAG TPA: glycosyltransferase family 9 protein [Pyrinomonadaceae bacterium]|nr:glycosyltransferase family 9 protein [Pyrinomonadaceae bacterium]
MNIDWTKVNRILVVRLRSIGDTVLSTASLVALRRFLPEARIDILLEDWVAPVLEGFNAVDNVIQIKGKNLSARLKTVRELRRNRYDVAFNLHGGTTATFFTFASGARYRVGFEDYQYNFLHNRLLSSSSDFWQKEFTHSAEQQLALLGFVGVPVSDKPKTRLAVTESAINSIEAKLAKSAIRNSQSAIALIHPAAAFDAKQWATENFARVAEFLQSKGFITVAVATPKEREVLENLKQYSHAPISTFDDLTLPEITALASKAKIFVGNDSGIAHLAAAVQTPSVVIFGSSNINHWRPWTDAPNEIVYAEKPCNHLTGEVRKGSENPKCIFCVEVEAVCDAIEKVLATGISVDEKSLKS